MKKLFIISGFICLILPSCYANDLDTLVRQGNAFYMDEAYEKAVDAYESVIDSGYVSAELYYNLGNAYYKSHNITMALVNYERALRLDPRDEETLHNLAIAREFVVDKIDVLPEFFLLTWFRGFVKMLDPDLWASISITAFVAALCLLLIYFFSMKINLRKASFWMAVLLFIISVSTFVFAAGHNRLVMQHNQAIVLSPSVTIKSSPDEQSGTDLFLLHEGTKVTIEDQLGDWREVILTDGNRGWLKKSDLILL